VLSTSIPSLDAITQGVSSSSDNPHCASTRRVVDHGVDQPDAGADHRREGHEQDHVGDPAVALVRASIRLCSMSAIVSHSLGIEFTRL
jgi:hypothetical protein